MKKFILLIFLYCQNLQAQTALLDSTNLWSETICQIYPDVWGISQTNCNTSFYKVLGDTIVSGFTYKKVYQSYDSLQSFIYKDALRYDSLKVYRASDNAMLYDFNIQVGDTFESANNIFGATFVVNSIDSILINGVYKKRIKFLHDLDTWIEDIGSLQGLLYAGNFFWDNTFDLLCFHRGTDLWYMNPNENTCYIKFNTDINEKENDDVSIAQFKNELTIVCKTFNNSLLIVDLTGKILDTYHLKNETTVSLDNLNSGIYLVVVINNQGQSNTKKIVVY